MNSVEDLKRQYMDIYRRNPQEFFQHYEAISKCAGHQTPESHVDALVETTAGETWRNAYARMLGAYLRLAACTMVVLLAGRLSGVSAERLVFAPVVLIAAWAFWAGITKYFLDQGFNEIWEHRTVAMKEYLNTHIARLNKQAEDEEK